MAAFVIVETDITDPDQYERYKEASPRAVAAGGGQAKQLREGAAHLRMVAVQGIG
jgi:uncharacterized protein (DUF1330 family)